MSPWRLFRVSSSPQPRYAFTLVELLVVVLIIGILAAIALPRFLGQRTRAKNAAAQAAVRHALLGARSYYTQQGESYAGLGPTELQGYESSLSGAEPVDSQAPGGTANPQDIWIGNGVDGTNPASGDANGGKTVVLCSISRGNTTYCVRDVDGATTWRSGADAVDSVSSAPAGTVIAMTGGWGHACALLSVGTVKCWGNNGWGELGNNATANSNLPVQVVGLSGVTAISAGGWYSCALSGGKVYCWGDNRSGQLGDGTTDSHSLPTQVPGISNAVSLGTGYSHTCVILSDGTGRCWGGDYYGELGDSAYSGLYQVTPKTVNSLASATSLVTGWYHTCAYLSTGNPKCWGYNSSGQLGDGTTTNRDTATSIAALAGASNIQGGRYHTCALFSGGEPRCWGLNSNGQVGDGTTIDRSTPTAISGWSAAAGIAAGEHHSCALSQGSVSCWGWNNYGQVGDGTNINRSAPTQVQGLTSDVVMLAPSGDHSCALMSYGTVKCWGSNGNGELGDGTWTQRRTPVAVKGL